MTHWLNWYDGFSVETLDALWDEVLRDWMVYRAVVRRAVQADAILAIHGDDDVPWRKGDPFVVVVPGDDVPF